MINNKSERICSDCYYVRYCENNTYKISNLKYKSIKDFELFLQSKCLTEKITDYNLIKGGDVL